MSYFKSPPKITTDDVKRVRELNPGMGLFDAKKIALKNRAELAQQMALEAIEDCRFDATAPYSKVNHTILDLLEYLIRK